MLKMPMQTILGAVQIASESVKETDPILRVFWSRNQIKENSKTVSDLVLCEKKSFKHQLTIRVSKLQR